MFRPYGRNPDFTGFGLRERGLADFGQGRQKTKTGRYGGDSRGAHVQRPGKTVRSKVCEAVILAIYAVFWGECRIVGGPLIGLRLRGKVITAIVENGRVNGRAFVRAVGRLSGVLRSCDRHLLNCRL